MRIVIQSVETGLFWKKKNEWSFDPNEAHDFETSTLAENFCRNFQLNHTQVVIKFENIPDVELPVVHLPRDSAN